MEEQKTISKLQDQIEDLKHDLQKAELRIISEIDAREQIEQERKKSEEKYRNLASFTESPIVFPSIK
jgi:hypothetical protein